MPEIRLCRTDAEHEAWDQYLYNYPGAHYFQSYGWLKSYEAMGFTAQVLVYEEDGDVRGGVAFLTAKLPLVPWRIFLIPHGPIPSDPEVPSWEPLMKRLDETCREQGAVYAQLYPHELSDKCIVMRRLKELGFTSPPMFTGHRFSSTPVLIDLSERSEEDILMSFRQKTRQYVRKALSSKCTVSTEVSPICFDKVYALLSEHGDLMGYSPRPYASLRASWEWFARKGNALLVQAWRDEVLVGAIFLIFTGRTAYYLAGAVRRGFAEYRPAELLHWRAICEAIQRKMDTYDLVNVGTAGVAQFKAGFRPEYRSWHEPTAKIYRPTIARMMRLADRFCRPLLRGVARYFANRLAKPHLSHENQFSNR